MLLSACSGGSSGIVGGGGGTPGAQAAPSGSPSTTTLDAGSITLPGSTTQPNSGNNNFSLPQGHPGASIYAIDCAGATLPAAGEHCNGGIALIGVFDSH